MAIVVLSIATWLGVIVLGGPQPPAWHDMVTSLIYLVALSVITVGRVSHNR